MQKQDEVLLFLKDSGGARLRSQVCEQVFKNHITADELDQLLRTVLSGLVTARKRKNRETWKLTESGWAAANQIVAQKPPESQETPVSDAYQRFKALAQANPDASPQRLLQLAGRHLGDPLEDTEHWRTFRAENPEWYLQPPQSWYAADVALDESGYPLRYPSGDPLTAKEREVRPATEQGWFERAVRQPGASLEPLAVEMPAYEVANILRVTKKIGQQAAEEIFGSEKIATARRLVGLQGA
jgi:hypothetical protein